MKLKKNKGFTLIEILIVIGIIAILAAVVLVAINPARQFAQANDSQRTSNVNAILNAVGQYIADNRGGLPTLPAAGAPAEEIGATLCGELVPTYIPSLPTDPSSGNEGASISCADIAAGVEYFVEVDTEGRVTVSAPETELCSADPCPADEVIEVTR